MWCLMGARVLLLLLTSVPVEGTGQTSHDRAGRGGAGLLLEGTKSTAHHQHSRHGDT